MGKKTQREIKQLYKMTTLFMLICLVVIVSIFSYFFINMYNNYSFYEEYNNNDSIKFTEFLETTESPLKDYNMVQFAVGIMDIMYSSLMKGYLLGLVSMFGYMFFAMEREKFKKMMKK